ncbi:Uncharacterized protein NEOC65_000787 [Neochlamydia sp. AcF65]|uniref:hypothetical protein n=1 Tax=Neochlamydia sp. AcF65 TaxID=2795735 RepID=UPI001BC98497|nr:hypothetical protein [Neochlamydia sp. AcF65]MBS4165721.1 Uncharacterized protein [Neochlamydia sp. AcF65]
MKNTLNEEFNLDHLDIINCYLKETSLKSSVIYKWLENARRQAITHSTDSRFPIVRRDFTTYLDKRIATFQACILKEPKENAALVLDQFQQSPLQLDIWRAKFVESSSNQTDLLTASMHVQDLLFACQEIIRHLNFHSKYWIKKELMPFIDESLPTYLSLLPNLSDELKCEIHASFKELKNLIIQEDFRRAEAQLNLIQNRIMPTQKAFN